MRTLGEVYAESLDSTLDEIVNSARRIRVQTDPKALDEKMLRKLVTIRNELRELADAPFRRNFSIANSEPDACELEHIDAMKRLGES